MILSFRATRNLGLAILLVIIFLESIFSYATISNSSERLTKIITVDNVKLSSWYDVAEIISTAKDQLYYYRLGKVELVAPVDLLVNKAIKEMNSIRELASDEEEIANIDEIVETARKLRQAIYAYESEVREGYKGGSSAKEMEELAIKTADEIVQLGRGAANYVSLKIEENNKAILDITRFSKRMLAMVLFFAIIATGIVAVFMARALAKPIQHLVHGTKKLADGNLSYRVKVESDDEIGTLAKAFNSMAVKLTKSRQELLASKNYMDNIIKSMTNSLVVINNDGTIRAANQATLDLLGYREKDLIGRPLSVIFAEGYFEEPGISNLFEKGFASNVETTFKSRSGKNIRVLFSGSAIRSKEEEYEGIVCVAQDISIQTEAMRAGHLASIGELAAGVAHEINNPINGIINFAQLLIDELERGEMPTEEIPTMIIKEGDRVATIVKSLLSFARIKEDEQIKKPISIREILDEVLALTEAQLYKDGIGLTMDVPKDLPKIHGNFQQIQQVFLNIVNNSRYALNSKFSGSHPDKKLSIQGVVETLDDRPHLGVIFFDRGVGIPKNIIDKIMNPFYSSKPAGLGTGLGLTISHGIITDHHGKLIVESSEGEFTKVSIVLPVEVSGNGIGSPKLPRQSA